MRDMSWRIRQRLGGILLLYLVSLISVRSLSNDTLFSNHTLLEDIPKAFANISKENVLWDSLIRDCKNPTFACIQTSMYNYLNNVLEYTNNYEVGGFIKLARNNVTYNKQETNEIDEGNVEEEDGEEEEEENYARSSPLEEVTSALHEKAVKFMVTHDMKVQLPDTLFEGSTLQISPRSFEGSALIAKLELIPKVNEDVGTPRIFFKKVKQIIGEKLMNALMAILLVLSLFSAKFMFFTPMIMGMAAAKKLLLKVLLFFFPFLAHIFKLCPYYEPHQPTKFHHHHHQIAHLHHVPPPHVLHHPPIYDHHEHHDHHDHHDHHEHHDPHHDNFDIGFEYYSDGPEFTNEFISHRKTDQRPGGAKDENDLYSWIAGQGQGQEAKRPRKPQMNRPLTPAEIEKLALKAEKEAVLKVRLQQEHQRVLTENKLLQEQIQQGLKLQEKLRLQASLVQQKRHADALHLTPGVLGGPVSGVIKPSQVLQTPPISQALHLKASQINPTFSSKIPQLNSLQVAQIGHALQSQLTQAQPLQTQILQSLPIQSQKQTFSDALQQAAAITFDQFYSPILEKIDKVLTGIGFIDESCKERLICSMYKNPTKFSPHSNLVSAELSRDASELQKPTSTNAAVIRFYRYVQAARDGQDKRECLRLYPSCAVNTEL